MVTGGQGRVLAGGWRAFGERSERNVAVSGQDNFGEFVLSDDSHLMEYREPPPGRIPRMVVSIAFPCRYGHGHQAQAECDVKGASHSE